MERYEPTERFIFTAKGLRVNELRHEGKSFRKALAIAEEEFSNFRPVPRWMFEAPQWLVDSPRFGYAARGVMGFYLANGLAPDHPLAIPRSVIAEELDIPVSEIEGALNYLKKVGAIRITPQFSGNIRSADMVSLCDAPADEPPTIWEKNRGCGMCMDREGNHSRPCSCPCHLGEPEADDYQPRVEELLPSMEVYT